MSKITKNPPRSHHNPRSRMTNHSRECRCASAEIDSTVTLWHYALNQQLRINQRNHTDRSHNFDPYLCD